jgi:hypothetical protein
MTEEDFAELERAEQMPGARIDKSTIPPLLLEGLTNYAQHGHPVGSFLQHVISNHLVDAVGQADPYSRVALPSIVSYVYMDMPSPCWGSKNVYNAWVAYHGALREEIEGDALQVFIDALNDANAAAGEMRSGRTCPKCLEAVD